MYILAGTSNPGNTNVVIPVLKEIQKRDGINAKIFTIGEKDSEAPRYNSSKRYEEEGFKTLPLTPRGYERYSAEQVHNLIKEQKPIAIITSSSEPAKKFRKIGEKTIDQILIQAGNEANVVFTLGSPYVEFMFLAYEDNRKTICAKLLTNRYLMTLSTSAGAINQQYNRYTTFIVKKPIFFDDLRHFTANKWSFFLNC